MGKASYNLNDGYIQIVEIDCCAEVESLTRNADFRKEDEHIYIFTSR